MFVFAGAALAISSNINEKLNNLPVNSHSINRQSDKDKLTKLKKAIDAQIGKPKAKRSAQCRVIAFGAKPCGGPRTYLVYSTLKTNESKLERLVNEYNSLEDKYNKENDLASDCMMVTEPEVALHNGMCKIKGN
ncbi:MAG TPA: hypothetical protein VK892_08570 [Pyrinomonadaceae bacterium]|nr:hypothetical protein [Pyrinomonadaceae bacterium]